MTYVKILYAILYYIKLAFDLSPCKNDENDIINVTLHGKTYFNVIAFKYQK